MGEKIKKDWTDKVKWEKLDKEKSGFVLSEAKENLKNIIENNDKIQGKATAFLSVIIGLVTISCGFFVNEYSDQEWSMLSLILLFIILNTISSVLLVLILYRRKEYPLGYEPKNILAVNEGYAQKIEMFKNSVIIDYQRRINENKSLNDKKASKLRWALGFTLVSPLAYVILAFVFIF